MAVSKSTQKPGFSVAEQALWAERITKEKSVGGNGLKKDFSVRATINGDSVPSRFKPQHMDPREAFDITANDCFDPTTVGLSGDMAREFRRTINGQKAAPRERHQFCDTAAQEIGWVFSRAGPVEERSQPSGSDCPQTGFGWQHKDDRGSPKVPQASRSAPLLAKPGGKAPPRKSKDGNFREELGVPPWPSNYGKCSAPRRERHGTRHHSQRCRQSRGSQPREPKQRARRAPSAAAVGDCMSAVSDGRPSSAPTLRRASASVPAGQAEPRQMVSQNRRPTSAPVARAGSASSLSGGRPAARGAGDQALPTSVAAARRPQSAPAVRAAVSRQAAELKEQEVALDRALEHSRTFLNGHCKNTNPRAYAPMSTSDVSKFASAFYATWGTSFFQLQH